jgi:peptidoglycan/LPS O-acetylase OafA/YrhL
MINATIKDKDRVGGLDELRGLAVLWVMICHGTGLWTWMPFAFAGYGFHGVVLFFVISGYLITRILVEGKGREQYFSHFYINRFFRIWPLMLLVMAVSAVLWPAYAKMGVFNLLMINNYAYAFGGNMEPMMRTDVMWSLAIEEQFYLFWPVLVFFLSKRALGIVSAVIVFVGLCFDAGLIPSGHVIIFKTTHGNMQYIAMGALLAIGKEGIKHLMAAWGAFMLAWMGFHGIGALSEFRWIWYGVSFALGLLVYLTIYWRPLVRNSWLADVGKLCYGLYLIHFFISYFVMQYLGRGVWMQGLVYFVVSFVLAILSFKYFERPMLNLRTRFHESERLRIVLFASFGFVATFSVVMLIPVMRSLA